MKKKILGLAAIAMSMISFSSLAQTQQSDTCCETSQQCVASQYNCPVGDIQGKKADPFTGLTLTDSQKAQLQQLKTKCATERSAQRAEKRQARRDNRKQYLEEVKAIIGPDQYVMFLENIVLDSPNGASHHKAISKADRRGKSFDKADKSHRHHASNRPFKASKAAKPSKATQATQTAQ